MEIFLFYHKKSMDKFNMLNYLKDYSKENKNEEDIFENS